MMITKTCTKCKQEKDLGDFYRTKIGYVHSWCKQCEINRGITRPAIHTRNLPGQYGGKASKLTLLTDIRNQDLMAKSACKSACKILKIHHEKMKGDPEHLTTTFLQDLMYKKCRNLPAA
jgi:hypothetical protein